MQNQTCELLLIRVLKRSEAARGSRCKALPGKHEKCYNCLTPCSPPTSPATWSRELWRPASPPAIATSTPPSATRTRAKWERPCKPKFSRASSNARTCSSSVRWGAVENGNHPFLVLFWLAMDHENVSYVPCFCLTAVVYLSCPRGHPSVSEQVPDCPPAGLSGPLPHTFPCRPPGWVSVQHNVAR